MSKPGTPDQEIWLKTDSKLSRSNCCARANLPSSQQLGSRTRFSNRGWYLRIEVVHGQWVIAKCYDPALGAEVRRPRVAYSPVAGGLAAAIANATALQEG